MTDAAELIWRGSQARFIDRPTTVQVGGVAVGRYGGRSDAGANKNEDGALVWHHALGDWTFALLLDAHNSDASAGAVLDLVAGLKPELMRDLELPVGEAFASVQGRVVAALASDAFRARCRNLRGETSFMMCARKGAFLWWLSVGDCVVYLLHPELTRFGQYVLNQRQFSEWVGQVNVFEAAVPAYTTGVRALRGGRNHILLASDGLLEFGDRPFEDARALDAVVAWHAPDYVGAVQALLERVHRERGKDSATVICWGHDNPEPVPYPSNKPVAGSTLR